MLVDAGVLDFTFARVYKLGCWLFCNLIRYFFHFTYELDMMNNKIAKMNFHSIYCSSQWIKIIQIRYYFRLWDQRGLKENSTEQIGWHSFGYYFSHFKQEPDVQTDARGCAGEWNYNQFNIIVLICI